jgi:hypothetical protein
VWRIISTFAMSHSIHLKSIPRCDFNFRAFITTTLRAMANKKPTYFLEKSFCEVYGLLTMNVGGRDGHFFWMLQLILILSNNVTQPTFVVEFTIDVLGHHTHHYGSKLNESTWPLNMLNTPFFNPLLTWMTFTCWPKPHKVLVSKISLVNLEEFCDTTYAVHFSNTKMCCQTCKQEGLKFLIDCINTIGVLFISYRGKVHTIITNFLCRTF